MVHGLDFPCAGRNIDRHQRSQLSTDGIFNNDEQAPPSPDGTYVAYVSNTNDFAVQIVSTNNVNSTAPYNDPTAVLGHPTLKFRNRFGNRRDSSQSKSSNPLTAKTRMSAT